MMFLGLVVLYILFLMFITTGFWGSRMKQYCSNCIHCYWTDDSSYGGDFCCRLLINKGSNFLKTFWIHSKCEERHVGNSCSGYKRKWYKFWIK